MKTRFVVVPRIAGAVLGFGVCFVLSGSLFAQPRLPRVVVRGWVEGVANLSDVGVRLLAPDGAELGRTAGGVGTTGAFRLEVASLPPAFVAEASGGALGHTRLLAECDEFDAAADMIHIDPATTLVARLLRRQPGTPEAAVEGRVEHFLGLPSYAHLAEVELDPAFVQELVHLAGLGGGGLGPFLDRLERELELDPDATLAEASAPAARQGDDAGAPPPPESFVAQALDASEMARGATSELVKSLGGDLAKTYLGNWASGPGGKVVEPVFGWFLTAIGWPAGQGDPAIEALRKMDGQLAALSGRLTLVEAKIDGLRSQVGGLFTQVIRSEYNTRVEAIGPGLANDIRGAAQKIKWLADAVRGGAESPANLREDRDALLAAAEKLESHLASSTIRSALTANGAGADPLLAVYSRLVRHSRRFWSQTSAQEVQRMFDYFDVLQLVELEMACEWGHAKNRDRSWFDQRFQLYERDRGAELAELRVGLPASNDQVVDTNAQVVDPDSGLVWTTAPEKALGHSAVALNFQSIKPGGIDDKNYFQPPTVYYTWSWDGLNQQEAKPRIPTRDEVDSLRTAYQGAAPRDDTGRPLSFLEWLRREAGPVVWTPDTAARFLNWERVLESKRLDLPVVKAPLTVEEWNETKARLDRKFGVNSTLLRGVDGVIEGLAYPHWGSSQITLWWTSTYETQRVPRAYNWHSNKNDHPDRAPRFEDATRVRVVRFDAGNAAFWETELGRVIGRGYVPLVLKRNWLGDRYYDAEVYEDRSLRDTIDDREFQMVVPPDRYSGAVRWPDRKYGPYFWSGEPGPWLGAVVIAVRRLRPGEADNYYYPDRKP
jgi:hypothetical protein